MKFFILFNFLFLPFFMLGAEEPWYKIYDDALKNIEACRWEEAIQQLEGLITKKIQPNLQEPTYGIHYLEYLPYYHLGQAYFLWGDYHKALEAFQQAEKYQAVKSSAHFPSLLSLKNTAAKILALSAQKSAVQATALPINPADSALIKLILAQNYSGALRDLRKRTGGTSKIPAQSESTKSENTGFQNEYQAAVDAYLQGNYQLALTLFSQMLAANPQHNLILNWTKKINAELDQLSMPPKSEAELKPNVTEKIITRTVAPIFALQFPPKNFYEVRSSSISLRGVVADDIGINLVNISINGARLLDKTGQPLQLRPASEEEKQKYSFEIEVPLVPGKNEITLVAFDSDQEPHSEILPLTIIRKLAIYKTATFRVLFMAGLLVAGVLLGFFKYLKYRIAFVNKYNPYIAGAPILNEQMFFGREKLVQSILNTLHHNSLMLYGPRRIGKTSIQHQLRQRLEKMNDPEYFFIPAYIDLQGIPETKFFVTLIEDIIAACKNFYPEVPEPLYESIEPKRAYDGRLFSHDLRKVIHFLQRQTHKKLKLVLLLDEVDELNRYSERINQRLRSVFMKSFAENLVAVMAGTYIRKNWNRESSPWYNFFEEIEIKPLDAAAVTALIKTPVKGIFIFEEKAIESILEYSQGYPYLVQKFCVYAINRIIEERRRNVTQEDIEFIQNELLNSGIN